MAATGWWSDVYRREGRGHAILCRSQRRSKVSPSLQLQSNAVVLELRGGRVGGSSTLPDRTRTHAGRPEELLSTPFGYHKWRTWMSTVVTGKMSLEDGCQKKMAGRLLMGFLPVQKKRRGRWCPTKKQWLELSHTEEFTFIIIVTFCTNE